MLPARLIESLLSFRRDEDGAVTVDWMVLTAAVIGMGMAVLTPIAYETGSASEDVADYVRDVPVGYENN